jgi:hypothetical protein
MQPDQPRVNCRTPGVAGLCDYCAKGEVHRCRYMCALDFVDYGIMDSKAIARMLFMNGIQVHGY